MTTQALLSRYQAGRLAPYGHFGLFNRLKVLASRQHPRVRITEA